MSDEGARVALEAARVAAFSEHRRYLFAVAYRLLGVAEDAEDVLQDAWLRFADAPIEELQSPRAYLVTIVTRLALDMLRSARHRREEYVGAWLPEPVPSQEALPEELVEQAESASFAFLLMLERLSPVERAVLVLHDVFDYGHPEIAVMTGRTAVASRQTLRRARAKLATPSAARAHMTQGRLVEEFLAATRAGDAAALVRLLAPDVVLVSDGGGKVQAINRPLVGDDLVARFLVTMAAMPAAATLRTQAATLNGQPAVVVLEGDRVDTAFIFDTTSAGITAIYAVRNPDKLRRLGARLGHGGVEGR